MTSVLNHFGTEFYMMINNRLKKNLPNVYMSYYLNINLFFTLDLVVDLKFMKVNYLILCNCFQADLFPNNHFGIEVYNLILVMVII